MPGPHKSPDTGSIPVVRHFFMKKRGTSKAPNEVGSLSLNLTHFETDPGGTRSRINLIQDKPDPGQTHFVGSCLTEGPVPLWVHV